MNACAPIRLWPAMPPCASSTTPSSSTVEPAIPACATTMQCSPSVQLCPICTRLSILVPRPIRVSPSVPRSTVELAPISTSSSSQTRPTLWIFASPPPFLADVAEAVAADHHAGCSTTRSPSTEAAAITQRAWIVQSAPIRTAS
jgi:hypothetical protein